MAVTVANTRKRILPVWMNWYGKKPLIFFKHLSETNKISKNHQNWLRIVDRRHFQRFQTGFSHPVDPEIRIFFCPWQSTLKSLSLETLFAFLGGLQPSKRGGLDLEISGDSLLCVCIDNIVRNTCLMRKCFDLKIKSKILVYHILLEAWDEIW